MSLETSYHLDVGKRRIESRLIKTLTVLAFLLIALLFLQAALLVFIMNDCHTIYGLTLSGNVYESYSFTCENSHHVEPIYRKS